SRFPMDIAESTYGVGDFESRRYSLVMNTKDQYTGSDSGGVHSLSPGQADKPDRTPRRCGKNGRFKAETSSELGKDRTPSPKPKAAPCRRGKGDQ
ncbi:hypothetical protein MMC07_009204, partial [Pseudocyphellaria aurata]|nr:hypothetical protein [Pseudocyphellaria aurata]